MGCIVKHKNKKEGLKPPLLVCNHDKGLRQYKAACTATVRETLCPPP